ncbi:MAG: flippase [Gemmatimonadetes bacterium]|nr:flippase [Gemmatimonadota bacterium]
MNGPIAGQEESGATVSLDAHAVGAEAQARFLRNVSLNFVGQVLPILVGVASLPFVVRGLGPARFALFSLALLMLGNTTLLDIGLGRAVTKLLAEVHAHTVDVDPAAAFWTALFLHVALGVIGTIILLAATPLLISRTFGIAPALQTEAKWSFVVLALAVPVVLVGSCFRGALEAIQRFDLVNGVKIPATVALYALPVVLLFGGYGLVAIMVATLVSKGLVGFAYAVLVRRTWPALQRVVFDRGMVRKLVSFGGWVSAANVTGSALGYVDRFLIGGALGATALGYYSAAVDAVSRVFILPTSVVVALFPAFSRLEGGRKELHDMFGLGVKILIFSLLPLMGVLLAYGSPILHLWLGPDYATHSLAVFDIYVVGALINSLGWVPFAFLQARGRPDLPAKVLLYETPLFALLLWMAIGWYGITGAATVWGVRVVAEVLLFFWLALRVDRSVLDSLRRVPVLGIAVPTLVLGVLVLVQAVLPAGYQLLGLGLMALGVSATVIGMWRVFLEPAERTALLSLLRLPTR